MMYYELIPRNQDPEYDRYKIDPLIQEPCKIPDTIPDVPPHQGFYEPVRQYGLIAIEYKCRALFIERATNEKRSCPGRITRSTGLHRWKPGQRLSNKNANKTPIYYALSKMEGTGTVAELMEATGLPRSVIDGTLRNGCSRKDPYIVRSEKREPQAETYAYSYSLTRRGYKWIAWAAARDQILGAIEPDQFAILNRPNPSNN